MGREGGGGGGRLVWSTEQGSNKGLESTAVTGDSCKIFVFFFPSFEVLTIVCSCPAGHSDLIYSTYSLETLKLHSLPLLEL